MSSTPFSGVYKTKDGKYIDLLSGNVISPGQIKSNMTPFYGRFIDKDGYAVTGARGAAHNRKMAPRGVGKVRS